MKISIAKVVIFPVLIISSAFTIAILIVLSVSQFRQLKELYLSRFALLQDNFTQSVRQELLLGQFGELTRNCSNFAKNPLVVSVEVKGQDGESICLSSQAGIPPTDVVELRKDIDFGEGSSKLAGTAKVAYDLRPLHGEMKTILYIGLALILIGLLFNSAVYFLIRAMVVKPVLIIQKAISQPTLPSVISSLDQTVFPTVELESLRNALVSSSEATVRMESERLSLARESATLNVAKQIAHDIRAPLSALNMISAKIQKRGMPEAELLGKSIDRINSIADELLTSSQESRGKRILRERVSDVVDELGHAVEEFKIRYGEMVRFESKDLKGSELFIDINRQLFRRIISNLFQNSYEARLPGQPAHIFVETTQSHRFSIRIRDMGKGIPGEVKARLGKEEISSGKPMGNGMGLFAAKQGMESWGGDLEVVSDGVNGAEVILSWNTFPMAGHSTT